MADDKIANNPSAREISSALPLVAAARGLAKLAIKLGFGGEKAHQLADSADALLSQSDILNLPDQFNAAFVQRGWIATSSMAVDVMRAALQRHQEGQEDAADTVILDWLTSENIERFAISPVKRQSAVHGRYEQLREALTLAEEGRYWAAVPLILIASDGFASDVLGVSPFEKNADLTLFDSVVGHPTALPAAIAQLTKGVRKTSDETLSLPLRHGILHGRSLGYSNRLVCGKAWMLMIALADWASDKREEETRRKRNDARSSASWSDLAASIRTSEANRRAMDAFETRTWDSPLEEELAQADPPFAFREFLNGWMTGNFGAMARRAVNLTQQPFRHMAGRMRSDAELVQLIEFQILRVEQTTVARAEALVRMKGRTLRRDVGGEFKILAFRHTFSGDVAMPTVEGQWLVQQGCMFDLMHERTAETKKP